MIGIHDQRCTQVICSIAVTSDLSPLTHSRVMSQMASTETTAAEPRWPRRCVSLRFVRRLHHAAGRHSARHPAAGARALLVGLLCDHAFSGQQQARDRRRILQRAAHPFVVFLFPTTTEPSHPGLEALHQAGPSIAFLMIWIPTFSTSLARMLSSTA